MSTGRPDAGACLAAGSVEIAVCAPLPWPTGRSPSRHGEDPKKVGAAPPVLTMVPNPDILATLSSLAGRRANGGRPLVVGFAAETEDLVANAIDKRRRKGCDWIVANDVSPATGTSGGERNTVHLISAAGVEDWPTLAKDEVASRSRAYRSAFRRTARAKAADEP